MKLKNSIAQADRPPFGALFLLFFLTAGAFAQERREAPEPAMLTADETPLEQAVDPAEYIVGPGDEVTIGLWGAVNQLLPVPVTPEGTVIIPSVGEAKVGGLVLADAKKEIRAAVSKRYPTLEATVTLTKIREIKVRVSGAVAAPGVYSLPAYSRVSEAILRAGGLAWNGSRRNIELIRQSGDKKAVDLSRFEHSGEGSANPRILEGDRIVVPAKSAEWADILVAGEVSFSGLYEARPDDSLKILLAMAGGLTAGADSASVERVQKENGKVERTVIDLGILDAEDIAIGPGEQIFVRPRAGLAPRGYVAVRGNVVYPGYFDIEEGKTKLSEVIARSGGFAPGAILSSAYILRRGYFDPLFEIGDSVNPALIDKMNQEDLNFYMEKNRWKGAVVACDFVGLFERRDSNQDVWLYSGDEINVPRTSGSVYVLGRVARPGLLSYAAGERLEDYIERAGGYSTGSSRSGVKVLKSVSGGWIKGGSGTKIDAGDVVLVPRRQGKFWSTFRDVMAVTSNAAAIFFIVREATR